jgi:hypothetical protein
MNTQQHAILDRLDEFGWELAEQGEVDLWWADDMWRLRSIWSPQSCEVFLTFLIEPQADFQLRKTGQSVWAVKASAAPPTQWQGSEGEFVLDFGHRWSERLPELFSSLQKMRHDHVV